MNDIFSRLDNMNARVSLDRAACRYDWQKDEPWTCTIVIDNEGSTVETRKSGKTADEALSAAFTAFMRVADSGLPLALIAGPIVHLERVVVDDLDADRIPY